MTVVTRKSEVKIYLKKCLDAFQNYGLASCVQTVEKELLNRKVKFPLLEYCSHELFKEIPEEHQIAFCDQIEALKTEGGNVLLGIFLQNRLQKHFEQSLQKATEYISQADVWYVCDIIGERVFGYSLLHQPDKTIPQIKKLATHPSNWVVRSLGAGTHYAIKKGLSKENVAIIFPVLLSMANTKDKEIKQGVGWAAKTTAKFHPDIIQRFNNRIEDKENVANWFRAKINIGLKRNEYAKRN